MTRKLQRLGNSKGLVLTRTMLDHLGVSDSVEVTMENGKIVLTAPRHRQSFDEAQQATFGQYDEAMRRLAGTE